MCCCAAADGNVTWSLSVARGLIFPPRGWKIPAAVWLTARLLALTDSVQNVMQGPNWTQASVAIIRSITKRSTGRDEDSDQPVRSITPVWLYTHDRLHGRLCSLWCSGLKGLSDRNSCSIAQVWACCSDNTNTTLLQRSTCICSTCACNAHIHAQISAGASKFMCISTCQLRWSHIIKPQSWCKYNNMHHIIFHWTYTVSIYVHKDYLGSFKLYWLFHTSFQMFLMYYRNKIQK